MKPIRLWYELKMSRDSQLVYSTETGRIKPQDKQPEPTQSDGIIRIRRETKVAKAKVLLLCQELILIQAH